MESQKVNSDSIPPLLLHLEESGILSDDCRKSLGGSGITEVDLLHSNIVTSSLSALRWCAYACEEAVTPPPLETLP